MKTKQTFFKFQDGIKPISTNDLVCLIHHNGRGSTHTNVKITKIGKKYITINNEKSYLRDLMFEIETGKYKSDYSHHYSLYSSSEAYIQHQRRIDIRGYIITAFSGVGYIFKYISDDDLLKINRIVDNARKIMKEEEKQHELD